VVTSRSLKKRGEKKEKKKGEKLFQLPFPSTTNKIVIMIQNNNHVPRFLRF